MDKTNCRQQVELVQRISICLTRECNYSVRCQNWHIRQLLVHSILLGHDLRTYDTKNENKRQNAPEISDMQFVINLCINSFLCQSRMS